MRMESLTKKSVAIFLLSCGITGLLGEYVYAQWGWNPFSSRSQETADSSRSSFFSSPFDFGGEKGRSNAATKQASARPISDQTRRQIVEASRKYPLQQRQNFIKSFAGLTDQQARQRLQQAAMVQSQQSRLVSKTTQPVYTQPRRTQSSNLAHASNPQGSRASNPWNREIVRSSSNGMQQTSYSSFPSANQIPVRRASSSNAPENPFLRRQQSLGPGTASVSQVPPAVTKAPVSTQPAPALPSSLQSRGTASMRPVIKPAPVEKPQLPVIRPASSNVDTSHYHSKYSPAKSELTTARQPATNEVASRNTMVPPTQSLPAKQPVRDIGGPELSLLISRAEALAAASNPGPTEAELQQHITRHVDLRSALSVGGRT